ncbi:MAG: hypothetical protein HY402_01380 [Elusimicrobia bacterium]|nr:hypothetical protein [Elusimicrobiota bacterium]
MKNVLLKLHKIVVRYALFFAPGFIAFYTYWLTRYGDKVPEGGFIGFINTFCFIWILSLAYVFLALLFYKDFRETLLARLAGFKESDERERIVTSNAARTTFLMTLAIQIVLLIISLTNVHLVRNPDGHGVLSVGLGFSSDQFDIYALPSNRSARSAPLGSVEVGGNLLPPNISPILMLLLLVQIGIFKLVSRRHYEGIDN